MAAVATLWYTEIQVFYRVVAQRWLISLHFRNVLGVCELVNCELFLLSVMIRKPGYGTGDKTVVVAGFVIACCCCCC